MTSFSEMFVAARRGRSVLGLQPSPSTLAEAFEISAQVIAALGETVGGWKVGNAPDGTPVASPMYASGFQPCGGRWAMKPGLPMIPEVEIALRLSRDLPPRPGKPYTREDLLDSCSEALIGLEIIERRIPLSGAPFPLNLADDLGNAGYVLGDASTRFRTLDLANLHCRFWMGDSLGTDRKGGHAKGDPMVPFVDWANAQQDRLGGLRAGQIVTLGSLTPMIAMTAPAPLRAEIEGIGKLAVDVI